MINKERIINEFNKLISFDSLSFHEKNIYEYLINKLKSLGLKIITDEAGKKLSNNIDAGNNIYAILEGNKKGDPILFSSHMDTVSPGIGKKAIIEGDLVKSSGDTVLGYTVLYHSPRLNRSYDIPDERAHSYFLITQVEFLHCLQQRSHLLILYDGDDARVHLGPCVRTTAGLSAIGTTTLYLLKEREAFDAKHI